MDEEKRQEAEAMLNSIKQVLGERAKDFVLGAIINDQFYYWTSSSMAAHGMATKILMDIEHAWQCPHSEQEDE